MQIQVLGSGCPTCHRLFEMVQKAVDELGLQVKVDYISGDKGVQKIVELGVMSSPVLVVNDKVVMTGFTPDIEKIKTLITKASN